MRNIECFQKENLKTHSDFQILLFITFYNNKIT